MPAMLIAAPAAALVLPDLGAIAPLYHPNLVKVQLLLDFSGSEAVCDSCGTRPGMLTAINPQPFKAGA